MNDVTRIAVEKAGGPKRVAPECGCTRQAVSKWTRVPPKHVLTVERLSGVSRHALRPDIYGPLPPHGAVTGLQMAS